MPTENPCACALSGNACCNKHRGAISDGSGGTITHSGYTCTLPYWNELSTDAKTAAATLYAALKSLAEAATCPED